MPIAVTSPRLTEIISRENFVIRKECLQDKPLVLHAIANLFGDHRVSYVIIGGLAVQVYSPRCRPTNDIDLVTPGEQFARLQSTEEWLRYGFRIEPGRKHIVTLRHDEGNVNVDIIFHHLFAQTLIEPHVEYLEGQPISFCSPDKLAFTKLRTQQKNWPRDPAKRIQDRVHLIELLQEAARLLQTLKNNPMTTLEMTQILDQDFSNLGPYIEDDIFLLLADGTDDSDDD